MTKKEKREKKRTTRRGEGGGGEGREGKPPPPKPQTSLRFWEGGYYLPKPNPSPPPPPPPFPLKPVSAAAWVESERRETPGLVHVVNIDRLHSPGRTTLS